MKKGLIAIICIISVLFTVLVVPASAAATRPFKKHVLPGYILAADFDDGDEGVAYSPLKVAHTGNYSYRPGINLNFWRTNEKGGVQLSFNKGEWLTYTVEVLEDGEYEALVTYGTPGGGALFNLYVDGVLQISKELDSTGGFDAISEASIGTMMLKKGKHTFKFEMGNSGMNFNYVTFKNLSATGGVAGKTEGFYRYTKIPSIVEAEDYDLGAKGSYSKTGKNQGKKYRPDDPMSIFGSENDYYVRYGAEEYTVHTFDVSKSGVYDLYVKALTQGSMNISFDDSLKSVPVTLKAENQKVLSVYLEEGEHTFKAEAVNMIDIDRFRFVDSKSEEYITVSELNKEEEVKEETSNVTARKIYKEFYLSLDGSDDNDGSLEKPFKTIEKAKNAAKEISENMDGDIVINIMPGYYYIPETIVFNEEDSGKNGYKIVWQGYNKFEKPIFGGGIKITGWQNLGNGIWKASAPELEDTRSLFINDYAAQRARSKYVYRADDDYDDPATQYKKDGFMLSSVNFPRLQKPENAELNWDLYWTSQKTPVRNITFEGEYAYITLDQPAYDTMLTKSNQTTAPSAIANFYIENDLSLLDEEGEFYFDKDTKEVFYLPFPEENMETAEVYAASTEFLMKIEGSSNVSRIENLTFNNMAFKHGEWYLPSTEGIGVNQADSIHNGTGPELRSEGKIECQIQVNNAKGIEFTDCEFKQMGSGAVAMINSVSDSLIQGNVFTDIGGSGVMVGHWNHVNKMPEGVDRTMNIEICDNVVRRAAQKYMACTAFSVYYVNSVNVHHNDIKDMPYTGITMGWGWEAEDITATGNNHIDYNKVVDVMQTLKDGGMIYTLGPLRNTTIIGNHCVHNEDASGGIYLDQGSAYITVSDNVVEQTMVWLNARPNVNIRGITASGNFTDNSVASLDPTGVSISDTTVFEDGKLPEEAQKIADAAGVRAKYKNLLNGVDLPEWRTNYFLTAPKSFFSGLNGWIEAEDYMDGGEGVGFHKEGDVKLVKVFHEATRSAVGDTAAGEWLKYEVDVAESKEYRIDVWYSNAFPTDQPVSKTKVYMDDIAITDAVPCPQTKDWFTYAAADLGKVFIKEGTHIFKIEFVDNAYSFDRWRLFDESVVLEGGNDPLFDEGVYKPIKRKFEFSDMKGHWAETTVVNLKEKGIINGISETLFAPNDPVTLYQSAWLTLRTMGIEYNDSNWKEIAYNLGILKAPDEADCNVTRERFTAFTSDVYLKYADSYSMKYEKSPFQDMGNISAEYLDSVLNGYALGLVKGDNFGMFNPKNGLNRAEAATVIYNLYNIKK